MKALMVLSKLQTRKNTISLFKNIFFNTNTKYTSFRPATPSQIEHGISRKYPSYKYSSTKQ